MKYYKQNVFKPEASNFVHGLFLYASDAKNYISKRPLSFKHELNFWTLFCYTVVYKLISASIDRYISAPGDAEVIY